jgi:hypothetical protein
MVRADDVHVVVAEMEGPKIALREAEGGQVGSDVLHRDRLGRPGARPGQEAVEPADEPKGAGGRVGIHHAL